MERRELLGATGPEEAPDDRRAETVRTVETGKTIFEKTDEPGTLMDMSHIASEDAYRIDPRKKSLDDAVPKTGVVRSSFRPVVGEVA